GDLLALKRAGPANGNDVPETDTTSLQGDINIVVEIFRRLTAAAAARRHPLFQHPHDTVKVSPHAYRVVNRILEGKKLVGGAGRQDCHVIHLLVILGDQKTPAR